MCENICGWSPAANAEIHAETVAAYREAEQEAIRVGNLFALPLDLDAPANSYPVAARCRCGAVVVVNQRHGEPDVEPVCINH